MLLPSQKPSSSYSLLKFVYFSYASASSASGACTATEMIPTIEMISATEMTPNHHRNDPHHRNDTGGHHRNDPRNIGNGIKRTTKTGQQFRACFLFIYIASFLRCVIYLFTALYFAVNCLSVFFWFNTRQYLFKRCISLMSSISSNFFLYFCKKINLPYQCIELLSV